VNRPPPDERDPSQAVILEIPSELESTPASLPARKPSSGNGALSATPEALKSLPAEFARSQQVLPLRIEDGVLHLAVARPGSIDLIENIRLLT
jgi:Type II secretion system (T2SS), protein E, N-terminal domain